MFRSQSSDHHQGSITVLVPRRIPVCGCMLSVHTMYLSVWCLVMCLVTSPFSRYMV